MSLDHCLGRAEPRPGKHRQTQINGGGVQGVDLPRRYRVGIVQPVVCNRQANSAWSAVRAGTLRCPKSQLCERHAQERLDLMLARIAGDDSSKTVDGKCSMICANTCLSSYIRCSCDGSLRRVASQTIDVQVGDRQNHEKKASRSFTYKPLLR